MNMLRTILLFVAVLGSAIACNNNEPASAPKENQTVSDVEVYYFHYTRRCATCNAIEKVAQEVLNEFYAAEVKEGKLSFHSLNLEEEGAETAEKLNVDAQSLLIRSGETNIDLTDKAFLYARSSPEELKEAIKSELNKLF